MDKELKTVEIKHNIDGVSYREFNNTERVIMDIPRDGESITILGHTMKWDGTGWEGFERYLKKCDAAIENWEVLKHWLVDYKYSNMAEYGHLHVDYILEKMEVLEDKNG